MNNFELALNSVSFGQIGVGLLRERFKRSPERSAPLFLIANNGDLSSYDEDESFINWIKTSTSNALKKFKNTDPTFKLWHLNGSLPKVSAKQCLLSFYETDSPTDIELNLVRNNDIVLFTSEYTRDVFKMYGAENVHYLPLFFEKRYFKKLEKTYFEDGRIVFNVVGKFEKRKNHGQVITAWAKKYGNNPKYYLNCAVYNPFFKPEENYEIWSKLFGGKQFFNIKFHPFMQKNEMYNDFLNSGDIAIGMSGGENWDLPVFHSVGIGKHAVILDCNGYKGWANNENSVLVKPDGKMPAYDQMFFKEGDIINQGNFFKFDTEEFLGACDAAIERVQKDKVNKAGLKLQDDFSVDKTYDKIEGFLGQLV